MSVLTLIILMSSVMMSSGSAVRPVVTFTPNWSKIFSGESVTITCDVGSTARGTQRYHWYKNNKEMSSTERNITITSVAAEDWGDYQCSTGNEILSHPVKLDVFLYAYIILQAPLYIFEGDPLTLRCHSCSPYEDEVETFFQTDHKYTQPKKHILYIPNVTTAMTGRYQCKKTIKSFDRMDATFILVQDLFVTPEIRNKQSSVTEGDDVTLTCVTRRNPARSTTELQFAFYKNERNVQEFSFIDTYRVPSAQPKDSGGYYCDVRTSTGSVRKSSEVLSIQIEDLFVTPELKNKKYPVMEGDDVTLTCDTRRNPARATTELQFAFYRNEQIVQELSVSDTYTIPSAQLEDSGDYSCEARTTTGSVIKRSYRFSIQITVRPMVTFTPNWENVFKGDSVTLSCNVKSTEQNNDNYRWYKDEIRIEKRVQTFKITSAEEKDIGDYKCWTSTFGYSLPDRLYVTSKRDAVRPIVTFTPNWENVYEGDSVTLSCNVRSTEQYNDNYYWYRNNDWIDKREQTFTIISAELKDSGNYKCWARTFGDSLNASLYVNSKRSTVRPVVTFTPNWRKIFSWKSMTMACDVGSTTYTAYRYYWYKNKNQMQYEKKRDIQVKKTSSENSGDYQCSTQTRDLSYPIRLEVSDASVILEAPPYVFEGDPLTLRCHNRYNDEDKKIFIQTDNKSMQSENNILDIPNVDTTMTGIYQCVKKADSRYLDQTIKDETFIFVQDIFATPEIIYNQYPVTEGDYLSMTCKTRRNPVRATTELEFAFYRDGRNVQEFSSSQTYRVPSAQLEDSENFTCEVRTSSDKVRKRSNVLSIQIKELFSSPEIKIYNSPIKEGDDMTLTCDTNPPQLSHTPNLESAFYRDGRNVQDFSVSDTYRVPSAQLEDSGNYTCDVRTPTGSVRKMSNVLYIQIEVGVNQPQLTLIPEEAAVGDEIVLLCESTRGSLPIHYRFYHDGTFLGNITVQEKKPAELRLTIKSPTMAGPYYCDSSNDFFPQKQQSETNNLLVIFPVADVNITVDKDGGDVVFGNPLTFTCSVQHGTSPSFVWLHNEEVINKESKLYQIEDNGAVLYIDSFTNHHRGTYQCNVSNTLSSNRTFFVLSDIQNINVLEKSLVGGNILWSVLGILLLIILVTSILLIMFRHKWAPLIASRNKREPTTDVTLDSGVARVEDRPVTDDTQKSNVTDNDQGDYSNIPPRESPAGEDLLYSYIDINRIQASPVTAKSNDEFSVLYSVVKHSGDTSEMQRIEEMDDSANIYQNFTAKEH
ncbi:Fc receptor-like protein 3 isoform X2 [Mixophyes fleayi]|uniref:Fc receptor-like protein 3 isoform X2 n=1 Tax=Mixophyes fleayi TaxID=3061075 RepID=UPI003F4D7F60